MLISAPALVVPALLSPALVAPQTWSHWLVALVLNFLLISLAQRLPLLTRAGWVHAGILGSLLWGCLGLRGWLAVVIYLALGSAWILRYVLEYSSQ